MNHSTLSYLDGTLPVTHRGERVYCKATHYARAPHLTALQLITSDNELWATATFNADVIQPRHHVLIKNWSKNKDMISALVKAGIIKKPHCVIPAGHATGYACELTLQACLTFGIDHPDAEKG